MIDHIIGKRQRVGRPGRTRPKIAHAFNPPAPSRAGVAYAYPGLGTIEPEGGRRTLVSGSLAALFHLGLLGLLILMASLAPTINDDLILVNLLHETPEPSEASPAPRALAERRSVNFARQIQSVAPQVVNPRVIAEASPAVSAEVLAMDALRALRTPTEIDRRSVSVERVERIESIVTARAQAIDVPSARGSSLRGPVKIKAPVGPSVGPQQIEVANPVKSMGTGTLSIGSGSSVREGVASSRDVLGSPTGEVLFSIDTAVGDGYLRGTQGTGSGRGGFTPGKTQLGCAERAAVQSYLGDVKKRTYDRWKLPPGGASSEVQLRFRIDIAGSANEVELVHATDNSLGASAVDAMRAASPFPPMPETVRCLSNQSILATFTSDSGAS